MRLRHALIGVPLLLVAQAAFVGYDLTHSNRPHELRFVWLALVLAAASAWLVGRAVHEAFTLRPESLSSRRTLSILSLVSLAALAQLGLGMLLLGLVLGG